MKHKIIKTGNYLLIVDDSEIKMDDWYLDDNNNLRISVTSDKDYWSKRNRYKKVIAHLPLNNSPKLEGVDLLPPLEQEDDVEKLAEEYIDDEWQKDDDAVKFGIKVGYVQGYNKAKEKYKYTEEDIKNAYTKGFSEGIVFGASPLGYKHITSEEYIQSPSQQKMPTHFECEMEIKSDTNQCDGCLSNIPVNNGIHFIDYPSGPMVCQATKYSSIKKTIDHNGCLVLCGSYIY